MAKAHRVVCAAGGKQPNGDKEKKDLLDAQALVKKFSDITVA
jgi:hypothetical protein